MEMGWRSEGDQREIGGRSHLLLLLEGEYLSHELVELDESERSLTAPVEPARGREGAWGVQGHEKKVRGCVHGGVHGCVRGVCVEAGRGRARRGRARTHFASTPRVWLSSVSMPMASSALRSSRESMSPLWSKSNIVKALRTSSGTSEAAVTCSRR